MDMIIWLKAWLENDDTKIIYILSLILFASLFDFIVGWLNAKFNKEVLFSTSLALFGIMKKIVYFMLLVFFIPITMLVPEPLGISSLYVLYMGYLFTELQSIFSHLKWAEDDKQSKNFLNFLQKIFRNEEEK